MSNFKRSRIHVDTKGKWKLYAPVLPESAEPLGTVIVGGETDENGNTCGGEAGALIKFTNTGLYAMANGHIIKNLDGRKVAAALGTGIGRRKTLDGGKRVYVYLDEKAVSKAKDIGNGNISAGIRTALDTYKSSSDE